MHKDEDEDDGEDEDGAVTTRTEHTARGYYALGWYLRKSKGRREGSKCNDRKHRSALLAQGI